MTSVHALGYVVVRGPIEEWKTFGADVLGAEVRQDQAGIRLRLDDRAYRIVIEEGAADGPASLVALGWETASADDLANLVSSLEEARVDVVEDPATAAVREVRRLFRLTDPEGTRLELYYGPTADHTSFASPRGVKFVTGELGAGHVFLFTKDAKAAAGFYSEVLGFRLSDTIRVGAEDAIFLHCNPRHHSIALMNVPRAGLGHLMLEVDSLTAVGRAFDDAQLASNVVMSIGEHTNDLVTSFYLRTPSGFDIEYGTNGRTIDDDDWTVSHYSAPSSWGHHFSHPSD